VVRPPSAASQSFEERGGGEQVGGRRKRRDLGGRREGQEEEGEEGRRRRRRRRRREGRRRKRKEEKVRCSFVHIIDAVRPWCSSTLSSSHVAGGEGKGSRCRPSRYFYVDGLRVRFLDAWAIVP
jgi:hypothetical protein